MKTRITANSTGSPNSTSSAQAAIRWPVLVESSRPAKSRIAPSGT